MPSRHRPQRSFLKEVLEGAAGVVDATIPAGTAAGSGAAAAGSFTFYHHANRIEGARIRGVLGRDAVGNRLTAFETAAGIEVGTLLAGVQGEAALGAAIGCAADVLKNAAALGAAGNGSGTWHVEDTRAEGFRASTGLTFGFFGFLLFFVHVAVLAIFPVHAEKPPSIKTFQRYRCES